MAIEIKKDVKNKMVILFSPAPRKLDSRNLEDATMALIDLEARWGFDAVNDILIRGDADPTLISRAAVISVTNMMARSITWVQDPQGNMVDLRNLPAIPQNSSPELPAEIRELLEVFPGLKEVLNQELKKSSRGRRRNEK